MPGEMSGPMRQLRFLGPRRRKECSREEKRGQREEPTAGPAAPLQLTLKGAGRDLAPSSDAFVSGAFLFRKANVTQQTLTKKPVHIAIGLSIINWLVPGLGYILAKDTARGVTLFVIINAVFAIGLLYGGYIMAPTTLQVRDPNFNLVGLLTWFVQAFHGAGWLGLQWLESVSAGNDDAYFNLNHLARRTYSDIGSLHLLIAGGVNYFASAHLYDLLTGQVEAQVEASAAEEAEGAS